MKVVVIGGGPSGIISLDTLIKEGFSDVTLYDNKPELSGTWVYDELPPVSYQVGKVTPPVEVPTALPCVCPAQPVTNHLLVYLYLETNVEADVMEFNGTRIPSTILPQSVEKYGKETPFRHHTVIKGWLQSLVADYADKIKLNSQVERADYNGGKWILTLRERRGNEDHWFQVECDKVVVALGKYIAPYIPQVPGLDTFPGILEHSQAFRDPEKYRGKKVIVVGGSISAMDLIYEVLFVASKTILSRTRDGHLVEVVGLAAFDHPDIDRRGRITRVEGLTVYFDDGSFEKNVDFILYGTGYRLLIPFMPQLDLSRGRFHGIYQHVICIDNPSLAFVGFVGGGLTFKVFEWQAVLAARTFSGRAKLPSKESMYQWEVDRVKSTEDSDRFQHINDDFRSYFEAIRLLATNDGPGRKLPPFDDIWREKLMRGYQRKKDYFERFYKL